MVPFSREIWIEREDFLENPPRKFFRLGLGREVRLKHTYYITCDEVIKDAAGEIVELRCTYDPESQGGSTPDGRRVKGTLHWVSAAHAMDVEVRLYDHLFVADFPEEVDEGEDFTDNIDRDSLKVLTGCKAEPSLADAEAEISYQFLRRGYFVVDQKDSAPGAPVFNRAVSLRDSWARIAKNQNGGK